MSIVRLGDIDHGHSVQPVVPRKKGMETPDREEAALRINNEIDAARGKTTQFAGYYAAEKAVDADTDEEAVD